LWQTDLIEEEKTAIGTVHGVFYLDDYSRYLVGGGFFSDKGEEGLLQVTEGCILEHGLPQEVLSDNGSQYRVIGEKARAEGTRTRYESGWESLGVKVTFAAPYHPQTKGKEERLNRFIIEDFLNEVRDKVGSLEELNLAFEGWRCQYNAHWPHSSLGYRPPASRYQVGMEVEKERVFDAFAKEDTRKVRRNGKIQVGKCFYQLPQGYEGRRVFVQQLGSRIKVTVGKDRKVLLEQDLRLTQVKDPEVSSVA
jgi:hypothetical protein